MAGREPNFHKKYVVFWAKHLQMGPTKDIWGPLKLSYCLPPPNVTFLNRTECCKRFNVEDGDDNIKIMEHIIREVPPHTALLFDEVPLTSNKASYDWSSLENKKPEEVSVVVSLQPLLLDATRKTRAHNVKGPTNADVVSQCDRSKERGHDKLNHTISEHKDYHRICQPAV